MATKDIWVLLAIVAVSFGAYRVITSVNSSQTPAGPAMTQPTPTPINDDVIPDESTTTTFIVNEADVEKTKQEIANQFPEAFSQPEPAKSQIRVKDTPTGFLNVRDKASLNGKIVAKIKPGETYEYINQENGWYQIVLEGQASAWVLGTYATPVDVP